MAHTNSPLVRYTRLSPNHSGLRTHKIDTITPHCIVGHLSLETMGAVFATKRKASCQYGVDDNGRFGLYVEEKNRSWCSSSYANDQRAVTIEVACDKFSPYKITDKAMEGLVKLCADICKRNDIPKLLWKADKNLIGKTDLQNITVHRWFANKSCPGNYIYSQLGHVADEVNKLIVPQIVLPQNKPSNTGFPYKVRINAETLHYRKGPGTNHPVVGLVRKNEVYTITEEALGLGASKWGKLASGAGWISLNYCTKIG